MDIWWTHRELPWWAKLRQAAHHVAEAKRWVAGLERDGYWWISREPGQQANVITYRLHVQSEFPSDFIVVVGDAIHNMRSSLDTVAYTLADNYTRHALSDKQERRVKFPICKDSDEFEGFFDNVRSDLYGELEMAALRSVQPFALREESSHIVGDPSERNEEDYKWSAIRQLNGFWNIDKHRRLLLAVCYSSMTSWPSPADGSSYTWYGWPNGTRTFRDGDILGHLENTGATEPPTSEVSHSIRLTLAHDIYAQDIGDMLTTWHSYLCDWVIPRIFLTIDRDGNPPMGIGGGFGANGRPN